MKKSTQKNPFSLDVVSIRLVKDSALFSDKPFEDAKAVVEALKDVLSEMDREVFCVINLRSDGCPINVNFASMGTLNASLVCPRELFKTSILSNAANMIVVHNHPSGRVQPSREDLRITENLAQLCEKMGIPLLDHIVTGSGGEYFSFHEKGLLSASKLDLYEARKQTAVIAADTGKSR